MNEADPTIRVMALHALAYCERLFYLEEVEEIRVADHRVHAGRTLHEAEVDKNREWQSLELASDAWGIRGKVDFARYRDGRLGRHRAQERPLQGQRRLGYRQAPGHRLRRAPLRTVRQAGSRGAHTLSRQQQDGARGRGTTPPVNGCAVPLSARGNYRSPWNVRR